MNLLPVVAWIVLLTGALGSDIEQDLKERIDECKTRTGASDEEIASFSAPDYDGADATKEIKCFTSCLLEPLGIRNEDNSLNEGAVMTKVGPKMGEGKTKEILEACKGAGGVDRCDMDFKFMVCAKNMKD